MASCSTALKICGRIAVTRCVVRGTMMSSACGASRRNSDSLSRSWSYWPVHEPERNRDAGDRSGDVECRQAAKRGVLGVQCVPACGEVGSGLEGDGGLEHPSGEPHPAVGEGIDGPGEQAIGAKTGAAGERRAGGGDEPGDRRALCPAGIVETQQAAHGMPHQEHRTPLGCGAHRATSIVCSAS